MQRNRRLCAHSTQYLDLVGIERLRRIGPEHQQAKIVEPGTQRDQQRRADVTKRDERAQFRVLPRIFTDDRVRLVQCLADNPRLSID